jgi:hypothetical protein
MRKSDWILVLKLFGVHLIFSVLITLIQPTVAQFLENVTLYHLYLLVFFAGAQLFFLSNLTVSYGDQMYRLNLIALREHKQQGQEGRPEHLPFAVWKGFVLAAIAEAPALLLAIVLQIMGEGAPALVRLYTHLWYAAFSRLTQIWPDTVGIQMVAEGLLTIGVLGAGYLYGRRRRRKMAVQIYKSRQAMRQAKEKK